MSIYAKRFSHILTTGAVEFLRHHPSRKHRGGVDPLFRENDMRDYVKHALAEGRMTLPHDWPQLEVESRGRIDYCFVDGRSILATCEVKGPVRSSFFDPKRFGRNWTGQRFLKDVRNQLDRATFGGEHFLGLLFPFADATIRTNVLGTALSDVLRKLEATVPGAQLTDAIWEEIQLPTGTPLTTVVIQVTAQGQPQRLR
jgi:hypothetical protein